MSIIFKAWKHLVADFNEDVFNFVRVKKTNKY